jgi:hypothetical protein
MDDRHLLHTFCSPAAPRILLPCSVLRSQGVSKQTCRESCFLLVLYLLRLLSHVSLVSSCNLLVSEKRRASALPLQVCRDGPERRNALSTAGLTLFLSLRQSAQSNSLWCNATRRRTGQLHLSPGAQVFDDPRRPRK